MLCITSPKFWVAQARMRYYFRDLALYVSPRLPWKVMNFALFKVFPAIGTLLLSSAAFGAGSADQLIEQGDAFYARLEAANSLKFYLPAEKLEPNNVRLLVRISREYRHLMSDAGRPMEKLNLGGTALAYAKRAVTLAPDNPEAQLAVCISYGKLQPFERIGRLNPAGFHKPAELDEIDPALAAFDLSDPAMRHIEFGGQFALR